MELEETSSRSTADCRVATVLNLINLFTSYLKSLLATRHNSKLQERKKKKGTGSVS